MCIRDRGARAPIQAAGFAATLLAPPASLPTGRQRVAVPAPGAGRRADHPVTPQQEQGRGSAPLHRPVE
eukprot:14570336-Alexandrium_andersonii.AAC.1